MFGYGWGRGYGRGWGRGFGRGWRFGGWSAAPSVEGYTYIGPCRCGWGPHAFYRDPEGRIVHASQVFGTAAHPSQRAELEALKREKEELERRIREIESLLNRKEA